MRLAVFLLFLAIALATASAPAVAQLPATPEVEKPVKEDKKAKKPAKADEEDGDGDDDDDEDEDEDDEDEDGDDEDGDDEDGETGGGSDGGGSGDDSGPGGQDPAGPERSTNGTGSADEGARHSLASDAGCPEECDLLGDFTDGGEGAAILTAASGSGVTGGGVASLGAAEVAVEFEDQGGALGPSAAAEASPAVLALFALAVLGLLVGLGGGLRALHGRLRGG